MTITVVAQQPQQGVVWQQCAFFRSVGKRAQLLAAYAQYLKSVGRA
jgi:hypothetical protein